MLASGPSEDRVWIINFPKEVLFAGVFLQWCGYRDQQERVCELKTSYSKDVISHRSNRKRKATRIKRRVMKNRMLENKLWPLSLRDSWAQKGPDQGPNAWISVFSLFLFAEACCWLYQWKPVEQEATKLSSWSREQSKKK